MNVARAISRQSVIVLITIRTHHLISITTTIFGDSIPQGINSWNLDTRLCTAKCKCRFFGGATSKHFHYYIQPTLNKKKPENTYCCSVYGDK